MTIPYLNQEDFLAFLKKNGFDVIDTTFFDEYDRVIIEKDGHTFPLQMKKTYFYPEVVKICQMFSVTPPADHLRCYEQEMELRNRQQEEPEPGE